MVSVTGSWDRRHKGFPILLLVCSWARRSALLHKHRQQGLTRRLTRRSTRRSRRLCDACLCRCCPDGHRLTQARSWEHPSGDVSGKGRHGLTWAAKPVGGCLAPRGLGPCHLPWARTPKGGKAAVSHPAFMCKWVVRIVGVNCLVALASLLIGTFGLSVRARSTVDCH